MWTNKASKAGGSLPYYGLIFALLALASVSTAQEADHSDIHDQLHAFHLREFANYTFRHAGSADTMLKFNKSPVMTWQGDGDWFGDLFVWTNEGRPEVIGCIGSWRTSDASRGVFHEFHTLATEPLAPVRIGSRQMWGAASPLKFVMTEDAVPGKTAGQRAIQMRNIARALEVRMEADSGEHELRLLPKPLYRYSSESLGVIDGAIFSFVWTNGTDPEFLLLVEARNDGWYYAPARFTYRPLTFARQGKPLWDIPRHEADYDSPRLSTDYVTLRVKNVSLAELDK